MTLSGFYIFEGICLMTGVQAKFNAVIIGQVAVKEVNQDPMKVWNMIGVYLKSTESMLVRLLGLSCTIP